MGFLPLRKLSFLFLIISALLISTSYAGRQSKFLTESSAEEFVGAYEEMPLKGDDNEEITVIHERMLRHMNTHDYGRYDPSPSFRRPRHKLIPN
ncbi:protein CASPARIAN STRIP INTEGRITY FACTOR 1-like [Chenopodium quinoa]|uniref:protein CASPARIAN STRIP INTEGRITY FACTOR 1-like n=1 Tax=Chenopodium quinoa TaxID=63459 RepID=UPI000B77CAE8|nr:protein CASPARIAN STRIP INTEGRITY FACTOR 1-like [Chenopodium quinoa]